MSQQQAAPSQVLGGSGDPLHFSHANAYPPGSYRALLTPFYDRHEVVASLHRPLWQPALAPGSLHSWSLLGEDVERVVDSLGRPLVSIGHSMGASAVVMAAARRPELFRGLVLIEPVLVPRTYVFLLRLFGDLGAERVPLIRKTLQRTDRWDGPDQAFRHFRQKPVFRAIDDEVLWDYIEHGTQQDASGATRLRYSKDWEAQCYKRIYDLWSTISQLKLPILAIRGSHSDTLSASSWQRWQQINPHAQFLEVADSGHLLPLEQPALLGAAIDEWLATLPATR